MDEKILLPSRLALLRRRFPSRGNWRLYLAAMGPGLIGALAGNDAGGIGTYSLAGAQFGYRLLFVLFLLFFVMALVQEMVARMGAVTQKGLGELIREQYGVSWTLFALGVMFVANTATVVAEFAGIAAAGELFGVNKYLSVPLAAMGMWLLISRGPFRLVERILLLFCLVQLTYVFAAFKAVNGLPQEDGWSHILPKIVTPDFVWRPDFLLLVVGVVGTTVTPWMQFFTQANIVDKGIRISEFRYQKADIYGGAFASVGVAMFVVICTAATLHYRGIQAHSSSEIAQSLAIPLGPSGTYLFAAGLLGASLLATAVLPLATAYTYCEAFGWEMGLDRSPRQAPMFYGLFSATLVLGALVVLLPNVPLLATMLVSQTINGVLLPIVLVFMLGLASDKRIMGQYANRPILNFVAWSVVGILIVLSVVLLATTFLGLG